MHEDNVEEYIDEIRKIKRDFYDLERRVLELSQDCNCRCEQDKGLGTVTVQPEGAGEMTICLQCFGAEGCIF
jgi:hypothetical protein